MLSRLIQIAYSQELAQAGYVEDTSDDVVAADLFADAVEQIVAEAFEVEEPTPVKVSYPIFQDIIHDEDGDWLVISGTNVLGTAPTIVRARLLSNKNPFNKADLARPYQVRVFNVDDLRPMQGDRANWIKGGFVETDPYKGMTTEEELSGPEYVMASIDLDDWNDDQYEELERLTDEEFNARVPLTQRPIQGPRQMGIPLSPNLMYHYSWVDGHEVRTLRKIYR